jgi:hypothetical protein
MPDHVARGNDHLLRIARENNIPLQKLLDANPQLKRKPTLLFKGDDWSAGDAVAIPSPELKEAAAATSRSTPYEIDPTKLFLRLRLLGEDFKALKNADYELTIENLPAPFTKKGKTDAQGQIETEIPPKARTGTLSVSVPPPPGGPPGTVQGKSGMTWTLDLGALNPVGEPAPDDACISGVQARLNNLGFPCGPVNGIVDEALQDQIRAFRKLFGLPDGKVSDAALQNKLKDIHDAPDRIVPPSGST